MQQFAVNGARQPHYKRAHAEVMVGGVKQHNVAVSYGAALTGVVTQTVTQAQLRADFFPQHRGCFVVLTVAVLVQHFKRDALLVHVCDRLHNTLHHALFARAARTANEIYSWPYVHALGHHGGAHQTIAVVFAVARTKRLQQFVLTRIDCEAFLVRQNTAPKGLTRGRSTLQNARGWQWPAQLRLAGRTNCETSRTVLGRCRGDRSVT